MPQRCWSRHSSLVLQLSIYCISRRVHIFFLFLLSFLLTYRHSWCWLVIATPLDNVDVNNDALHVFTYFISTYRFWHFATTIFSNLSLSTTLDRKALHTACLLSMKSSKNRESANIRNFCAPRLQTSAAAAADAAVAGFLRRRRRRWRRRVFRNNFRFHHFADNSGALPRYPREVGGLSDAECHGAARSIGLCNDRRQRSAGACSCKMQL